MKKLLLLLAVLMAGLRPGLALVVENTPVDNQEFVTRLYPSGSLDTPPCTRGGIEPGDIGEYVKEYLAGLGVAWPEGSFVRYLPAIGPGQLAVHTTRETHARIGPLMLELFRPRPLQVRMQAFFYSFEPAAFEELELADILGTRLGSEAWKALRERLSKTSGVTLLACPASLSVPGSQAVENAVLETLYPTDFEIAVPEAVAADATNAPSQPIPMAVEPQNFQMRQVGAHFIAFPRLSSDSSYIELDLAPSLVLPPVWHDFGSSVVGAGTDSASLKMEQPFFPCVMYSSTLCLRSGDTVALGGNALDEPGVGRRFHVLFVTASLDVVEPAPSAPPSAP